MAKKRSSSSSVHDQPAQSGGDRTPHAAQADRAGDEQRAEPGPDAGDDESSAAQQQRHGNTHTRGEPPEDEGRNEPDDHDKGRNDPDDEDEARAAPDDEGQPGEETDDQPKRGHPGDRAVQRSDRESGPVLEELVSYLRESRTEMREEWARRIADAELLGVMSDDEIFSEATEVYDNYVDALETGSVESLEAYARELSERIIPRGVETSEVLGIVLLLRDVLARALFTKYDTNQDQLNRVLDAYEPAANRIAVVVGVSFVEERERVISEQQQALRELSTPVLQFRERLLILPIIGALDSSRARQLTEQLLGAIQENRARVVVIDITGVATVDRAVANHLVQTVEASRLMGASTILTGISAEIAQTLVDLEVDLGMMRTVGDLQGGLVEAERLAGHHSEEIEPATSTEI
jgi:rsbT co-antagonist protein RsbR